MSSIFVVSSDDETAPRHGGGGRDQSSIEHIGARSREPPTRAKPSTGMRETKGHGVGRVGRVRVNAVGAEHLRRVPVIRGDRQAPPSGWVARDHQPRRVHHLDSKYDTGISPV